VRASFDLPRRRDKVNYSPITLRLQGRDAAHGKKRGCGVIANVLSGSGTRRCERD